MPNARNAKSTREKAAALRAEAERAAARRRRVVVAVSAVLVVVLAVGVYALVRTLQSNQDKKDAAASKPPANVYTTSAAGLDVSGILYGKDSAKSTVVVFADFLCPICKQFEDVDGGMLRSYADEGKIKIVYKPVAILSGSTSTDYSTRSAAAAAAVQDVAPDKVIAYLDLLFANQPEEGGAGLPDSRLIDLAVEAGAPRDAVATAISSESFKLWVKKGTDEFLTKFNGTPTVLLNGTKVDDLDPAKLKADLDKAVAAAGA